LWIAVSVAAVIALYWPFAMFLWTAYPVDSLGSGTDAVPVYVLAPAGRATDWIDALTWPFTLALGEAVVGTILAICVYTVLTHILGGSQRIETRCRTCREVLRGLAEPRCPACDEPI
jgi:hypothetical protein